MNRITKAAVMDKSKALNSGIDKIMPNQVEKSQFFKNQCYRALLRTLSKIYDEAFCKVVNS